MLDKKHLEVCHLLSIGTSAIEIAKIVGISRNSVYDWKKSEEMKAKIDEFGQDFISSMQASGRAYAPKAMAKLIHLCETGGSDKTQLDAASKIIDKYMSNATKIEIDDSRNDNDNVTLDVLDQELNDIDNE